TTASAEPALNFQNPCYSGRRSGGVRKSADHRRKKHYSLGNSVYSGGRSAGVSESAELGWKPWLASPIQRCCRRFSSAIAELSRRRRKPRRNVGINTSFAEPALQIRNYHFFGRSGIGNPEPPLL